MKLFSRGKLSSFALVILLLISSVNVVHATSNHELNVHRISYKVFDSDNNFVSEGTLPLNQAEFHSRYSNYSPVRLTNGQTMYLYNESGSPFFVKANARIHMMFGLDSNSYAFASIERNNGLPLNYWQGFTGGHSFSAKIDTYTFVLGYIQNISSEPFTVTWASFDISY